MPVGFGIGARVTFPSNRKFVEHSKARCVKLLLKRLPTSDHGMRNRMVTPRTTSILLIDIWSSCRLSAIYHLPAHFEFGVDIGANLPCHFLSLTAPGSTLTFIFDEGFLIKSRCDGWRTTTGNPGQTPTTDPIPPSPFCSSLHHLVPTMSLMYIKPSTFVRKLTAMTVAMTSFHRHNRVRTSYNHNLTAVHVFLM